MWDLCFSPCNTSHSVFLEWIGEGMFVQTGKWFSSGASHCRFFDYCQFSIGDMLVGSINMQESVSLKYNLCSRSCCLVAN